MHNTLLIFLDGVGIGREDQEVNPFFKYPFNSLKKTFGRLPSLSQQRLTGDSSFLFPADAVMGISGLPQSGTGQTSIFCGVNAPEILGQHFGPFPHSGLLETIRDKNIFLEFMRRGMKPAFANAYPRMFFEYIKSGRRRLSVTSLSCLLSGVRLRKAEDLHAGRALSAEIDNSRWVERMNYRLQIISPERAAIRLLRLSEKHHFTVFEYYLSDHLGHGRNKELIEPMLSTLDRFLLAVFENMDKENSTLVICSDHGNLEDISVKSHTLNPSLTITAGKNAGELSEKIRTLQDIKPAIMGMYG